MRLEDFDFSMAVQNEGLIWGEIAANECVDTSQAYGRCGIAVNCGGGGGMCGIGGNCSGW